MIRRLALALLLVGAARVAVAETEKPLPVRGALAGGPSPATIALSMSNTAQAWFPTIFNAVTRTNTGAWQPTLGLDTVILDVTIEIGGGKSATLIVSCSATALIAPSAALQGTTLFSIVQSGRYEIRGLCAYTKIRIDASNGATVSVGAVYRQGPAPYGTHITGIDPGVTVPISGSITAAEAAGSTDYVIPPAAVLSATGTAASGSAVTVTLPSASGLFHYIVSIEITKYVGTAIVASGTPTIVTTTNLRNMAIYFRTVGAVADAEYWPFQPALPVQSDAVTTATTIVCPATAGVIWSVVVLYYTGP